MPAVSCLRAVRVAVLFDGHGRGLLGSRLLRSRADQVAEAGEVAPPANPVVEIVPEGHPQLAAGLLQAGKRVAATTARCAARAAAELAALDVGPDIRLPGVVGPGDCGPFPHAQPVPSLVCPGVFSRLGLIWGRGLCPFRWAFSSRAAWTALPVPQPGPPIGEGSPATPPPPAFALGAHSREAPASCFPVSKLN